jgi:alginate O-acetyltransferase complex protein AlgI
VLFNSWIFVVFFAIFAPVYIAVRKDVRARNTWLLVCSYFFYGWWNPRFVTLLAVLAAVDYLAALGVSGRSITNRDRRKCAGFIAITALVLMPFVGDDQAFVGAWMAIAAAALVLASVLISALPGAPRKKAWLYVSILANLGILAFFKYCNFFLQNAVDALSAIGFNVSPVALNIILPIGLSFHVFQGVSRTIDCYRGDIKPEGSLTTVATYLAFFPQLVAGPIERASRLIPQFERILPTDRSAISSGVLLFLWGLYQKLVVADNVAPIANAAFGDTAGIDGGTAAVGVLAFTIQIYCDFAGYSNMARGLARTLGFELMANFNLPYFARTPSEFWKRWHISLSSWLRDYLYIGLGGNRGGSVSMYRNLMITMLLGGLWHGAAWTFVAWGFFHGAIQVVYRILGIDGLIERAPQGSIRLFVISALAWMSTMILVMIGWVFFRATSFSDAGAILEAAVFGGGYSVKDFAAVLAIAGPLAVVEVFQRFSGRMEFLTFGPFLWRYSAALSIVLALLLFSARGGQEFIYFDF